MKREVTICNICEQIIPDNTSFFTIKPQQKKKVETTLALTAGGSNRIHIANDMQIRISLDIYAVHETGRAVVDNVDAHWKCLTSIVRERLRRWYMIVGENEELHDVL